MQESSRDKPKKRELFDCLKKKNKDSNNSHLSLSAQQMTNQPLNNLSSAEKPVQKDSGETPGEKGPKNINSDEAVQDVLQANEQRTLSVITAAAGGDDQSHVTVPLQKTNRRDLKQLLSHGMEPIHEREEEAGLDSLSKHKLDFEESYSFSLRNYPVTRSSQIKNRDSLKKLEAIDNRTNEMLKQQVNHLNDQIVSKEHVAVPIAKFSSHLEYMNKQESEGPPNHSHSANETAMIPVAEGVEIERSMKELRKSDI